MHSNLFVEKKTGIKFLDILRSVVLRELEERDILREGLTKSTEVAKTVGILKRFFPSIKFNYKKGENTFTTIFANPPFNLEEFLQILNNLGWFISGFSTEGTVSILNQKYEKDKVEKAIQDGNTLTLRCEATYDIKVETIPEVLYHLTPLEAWKKIQTQGLVPKSRSKKAYHPDRVYLGTTEQSVERLGRPFYNEGRKITDWVILRVRTAMLSHLELYQDPNYKDGYYTLNTITPYLISKVKEVHF